MDKYGIRQLRDRLSDLIMDCEDACKWADDDDLILGSDEGERIRIALERVIRHLESAEEALPLV